MDKLGGLWSNLNVSSKGFLIWGAISQGLGISWSPELSRAESGFSAFTLCTSHSVHIRPRQLGRPRYLVLEGRDNPRCKVVLASFNGSPRDILGARDNFMDRASTINRDISGPVFLMWTRDSFIPTPPRYPHHWHNLPHVNRPLDRTLIIN